MKDKNNDIIYPENPSSAYSNKNQEVKVLTSNSVGEKEGLDVHLVACTKESFKGSTTVTHTFTEPMTEFRIINDGYGSELEDKSLTFTIGNFSYTLYMGEEFDDKFEPFTDVVVTTGVAFRAYGRN